MLNISLNDLQKIKDIQFVNLPEDKFKLKHIKGISIDSRRIEPQQVFWSIKGENFDGHDFVKEVHTRNALCSIVEKRRAHEFSEIGIPVGIVSNSIKALQELAHLHRLKYSIPVLSLTGSNGKTTTKEMLAQMIQTKMNVHKTKGNQNNQIGCPLTMLKLSEMHEIAIVEFGTNQFGEIDILSKMVEPTHALVTLIGDTHLEYLKDRKGVAKEKLSLFDNLKDGATVYQNMDDPFIAKYDRKNLRYVTYSFENDAEYKGEYGPIDENGCGTLIVNGTCEIKLSVPGLHNVHNALAVTAVGLDMDFTEDEVKNSLASYSGYEKRMQLIKWNDVTIVNDAYNANPASMELAIESVLKIKHKGKVVLSLGDMNELGEKSLEMHKKILEYALNKDVQEIYLVGDKMKEAVSKLNKTQQKKLNHFENLKNLTDELVKNVKDGDILLLKGSRSMQMEKVMAYLP